jgi:DNA-binding NarL/FixJ family response regulator
VLLDLDMHCCDSFEAVGEVTRRRLSGAIVGLTIHEDSRERDAARKAGVSYFLEKGISSRQLVDTVKRLGSETPTP